MLTFHFLGLSIQTGRQMDRLSSIRLSFVELYTLARFLFFRRELLLYTPYCFIMHYYNFCRVVVVSLTVPSPARSVFS